MSGSMGKAHAFVTLDGIRGLAALFVVTRHVPYFGGIAFSETYLAVDLFFMLSGVVIANAYRKRLLNSMSLLVFSWRRIVRIYPLYLLGTLIGGMAWAVGGNADAGNLVVIAVLALLLFPSMVTVSSFPLDAPAWSLLSELLVNIFYGAIVHRLAGRMLTTIIGCVAAGLVVIVLRNHHLDVGYNTRDIPLGFFRAGFSFFVGVLLHRIFEASTVSQRSAMRGAQWVPWLILVALALVLSPAIYGLKRAVFDLAVVAIVFPVLIFGGMVCHPGRHGAMVFRWLGLVSYPVYVLHSPLSKWVSMMFFGQQTMLLGKPLWLGAVFMAVLLPLGWLLDKYYDQPLRRLALELLRERNEKSANVCDPGTAPGQRQGLE